MKLVQIMHSLKVTKYIIKQLFAFEQYMGVFLLPAEFLRIKKENYLNVLV